MSTDTRLQRLELLRTEVNSSLRSFLHRTRLLTPGSGAPRGVARGAPAPGVAVPVVGSKDADPAPGAVVVNVNLMGGTIFLDDERRVRALAKEIKRLITEDTRRGLGIGG